VPLILEGFLLELVEEEGEGQPADTDSPGKWLLNRWWWLPTYLKWRVHAFIENEQGEVCVDYAYAIEHVKYLGMWSKVALKRVPVL